MKILCIGSSAYDITLPLDHYPIADHKEDYEFSFSITKLEKKIKVMH